MEFFLETVSFNFTMRQPILDLRNPVYIKQSRAMVFSFAQGDGNKSKVADFISYTFILYMTWHYNTRTSKMEQKIELNCGVL